MNWADFFAMGGYAVYVWTVYALAAAVLVYNITQPWWRRRALLKQLRRYYRLKDKTK